VVLRFGILNQQAYGAGEPVEGIALWGVPDQKTRLSALVGAGFWRLVVSPFVVPAIRARNIFSNFSRMQKLYAPEPHYYLETISVLPQAQGRGLASRLIKPFLARADTATVSTYTETMTPANVPLYQHYGFQVMEQYLVPNTDLSIWALYRPVQRR
jgi:ribosomal protein S18 acetylase RimI-like enzyme